MQYLSDAVVEAEPEEQEAAQEGGLKEGVEHARHPAVHQERQRKNRVWNNNNETCDQMYRMAIGQTSKTTMFTCSGHDSTFYNEHINKISFL